MTIFTKYQCIAENEGDRKYSPAVQGLCNSDRPKGEWLIGAWLMQIIQLFISNINVLVCTFEVLV